MFQSSKRLQRLNSEWDLWVMKISDMNSNKDVEENSELRWEEEQTGAIRVHKNKGHWFTSVVSVHMHVCVHSHCVWWTVKWRVNLQRLHLTATSICFSHSLSHPALQQSCIPAGKIPSLLISKGPDTQRHTLAFERLHMIQEEKPAGSSTALTLYDRQTELHEALQYMARTDSPLHHQGCDTVKLLSVFWRHVFFIFFNCQTWVWH